MCGLLCVRVRCVHLSAALPPSSQYPALDNVLPVCPKVYTVVDEMFLAGEIRETSQTKVLKQLLMLQSLE